MENKMLPPKEGFKVVKVKDVIDIPELIKGLTVTVNDDYIEPLQIIDASYNIAEQSLNYIKTDAILPEYLSMELEEQVSQYCNMDFYFIYDTMESRIKAIVEEFAETELYIPEGDK